MTTVILGNEITEIGTSAFENCESLTSVTFGRSLETIGEKAFSHCFILPTVSIPNSVKEIGPSAFDNCSRLTTITIGTGLTKVSNGAFANCAQLKTLQLPESLEAVEAEAFKNCTSLTEIEFKSNAHLGESILSECKKLQKLTFAFHEAPSLGYLFGSTDNAYGFIPDTLKQVSVLGDKVPSKAFLNCSNITSITLAETITKISQQAFNGCTKITTITLPAALTSIEDNAFKKCTLLTSVIFMETTNWTAGETEVNSSDLADDGIAATALTDTFLTLNWVRENE